MKKKLFRVDINLSYLYLTDDEDYGSNSDIEDWLKNDFHSGELDGHNGDGEETGPNFSCVKVEAMEQVSDFNLDYDVYGDNRDELTLKDLKDELGLDSKIMIDKLVRLGYKVTAPAKKKK